MSTIGSYIKQYRTARGITQEQLGELVGVSTQAVSKWERGGTPDTELLPRLAEVLGVSIDALFGKEEQNLPLLLARKLRHMTEEEAFPYAFGLCWGVLIGLFDDPDEPVEFLKPVVDYRTHLYDNPRPYGRIMRDSGMSVARLYKDFQYFFLMPEPKSGLWEQLTTPEELHRIFSIFANPKLLKIICYLYTRLNTPLSTSLISKNVGMPIGEVDALMDILRKSNLVRITTIATADGDICSYTFNLESAVIPLLCFADELARGSNDEFLWSFSRSIPLFHSTDG